ncbi:MAG: hypothetical protein ACE3JK_01825 [Sporolactobacillus sp.]
MEYHIPIPEYIWFTGEQFKPYVLAYLAKNEPDMKPVRIVRHRYIVCIKEDKC